MGLLSELAQREPVQQAQRGVVGPLQVVEEEHQRMGGIGEYLGKTREHPAQAELGLFRRHQGRRFHRTDDQRAHRVHHVGAGADRDEPGERTVVDEPGIVLAEPEGRENAAAHGEQRVHGDETRHRLQALRAHHVEAEPADAEQPRAHGRAAGDHRASVHEGMGWIVIDGVRVQ